MCSLPNRLRSKSDSETTPPEIKWLALMGNQRKSASPLLALPAKCRIAICDYLVAESKPIDVDYLYRDDERRVHFTHPVTAVQLTCRLLYREMRNLFYSKKPFYMSSSALEFATRHSPTKPFQLHLHFWSYVRHLHVDLLERICGVAELRTLEEVVIRIKALRSITCILHDSHYGKHRITKEVAVEIIRGFHFRPFTQYISYKEEERLHRREDSMLTVLRFEFQECFPFLRLPGDIRDKVYHHALRGIIKTESQIAYGRERALDNYCERSNIDTLALVCIQMYRDVCRIRHQRFHVDWTASHVSQQTMARSLPTYNSRWGQVRWLHIAIDDSLMKVSAHRAQDISKLLGPTFHLPHLEALIVEIHVHERAGVTAVTPSGYWSYLSSKFGAWIRDTMYNGLVKRAPVITRSETSLFDAVEPFINGVHSVAGERCLRGIRTEPSKHHTSFSTVSMEFKPTRNRAPSFHLLALPQKVRTMIYSFVVAQTTIPVFDVDTGEPKGFINYHKKPAVALMCTSRQLNDEVRRIFFARKTIHVVVDCETLWRKDREYDLHYNTLRLWRPYWLHFRHFHIDISLGRPSPPGNVRNEAFDRVVDVMSTIIVRPQLANVETFHVLVRRGTAEQNWMLDEHMKPCTKWIDEVSSLYMFQMEEKRWFAYTCETVSVEGESDLAVLVKLRVVHADETSGGGLTDGGPREQPIYHIECTRRPIITEEQRSDWSS